ncbi:uncharacterized protein IL334_003700 [Kwoniella shivajii]|uniref:Uncharacterized protein n=1 Tax=Kwoniella shivajii TaxID=564305 RepID=A0ABZ1CZG9_9TREE|nr:hypothetical protein IL334_003700 [Kwoniella shivajii]
MTSLYPTALSPPLFLTPLPSPSNLDLSHLPKDPSTFLLNPSERLEKLLSTISSVLTAYSLLPNPSPMYLTALSDFHHRAAALSPNAISLPPTPPSSSPQSTKLRRSLSYNLMQNQPQSGQITPLCKFSHTSNNVSSLIPLPPSPSSPKELPLTLEAVERLEKDWWNSEVVAAWYGPRSRRSPDRRHAPASPGTQDSSLESSGLTGQRKNCSTTRSSVHRTKRSDGKSELAVMGDTSYVGLNDE